jgi:hypothetical protein
MDENKSQKAAHKIVKWTKETGFNISVEKTKAMLIHRGKPRVYEPPKLKVRLGPNVIEMVRQHRILGLIIDGRLNWKVHLKVVKARAGKKLGLLERLAHKKWGRYQNFLIRIHQLIVLSALRYGESI